MSRSLFLQNSSSICICLSSLSYVFYSLLLTKISSMHLLSCYFALFQVKLPFFGNRFSVLASFGDFDAEFLGMDEVVEWYITSADSMAVRLQSNQLIWTSLPFSCSSSPSLPLRRLWVDFLHPILLITSLDLKYFWNLYTVWFMAPCQLSTYRIYKHFSSW